MDGKRFDTIAKALATTSGRRRLLGAVAGGLGSAVVGRFAAPDGPPDAAAAQRLPAPRNLRATPRDSRSIYVSWGSVVGARGYTLTRDGVKTTVRGTSNLHTGLAPSSFHCYVVRAFNNVSTSRRTTRICTTTPPDPCKQLRQSCSSTAQCCYSGAGGAANNIQTTCQNNNVDGVVCCRGQNAYCGNSAECCGSLVCVNGRCGVPCKAAQEVCSSSSQCCSRPGMVCQSNPCSGPPYGNACCVQRGYQCGESCDCCGLDYCVNGYCVAPDSFAARNVDGPKESEPQEQGGEPMPSGDEKTAGDADQGGAAPADGPGAGGGNGDAQGRRKHGKANDGDRKQGPMRGSRGDGGGQKSHGDGSGHKSHQDGSGRGGRGRR